MLTNTQEQLVEGVLRHGPDILNKCLTDPNDISQYLKKIDEERLNYPIPLESINSNNWFIPKEYQDMDIESWLVDNCPKEHYDRLIEELVLYRDRDFIPILKAMKYIVDTLRKNNVVWGVGRGSSVASYVLYLIGVHKIDSIKYSIPIEEFFKGEQNG